MQGDLLVFPLWYSSSANIAAAATLANLLSARYRIYLPAPVIDGKLLYLGPHIRMMIPLQDPPYRLSRKTSESFGIYDHTLPYVTIHSRFDSPHPFYKLGLSMGRSRASPTPSRQSYKFLQVR